MSDYGIVPTEAVDPRRFKAPKRDADFRASRPSRESGDSSESSSPVRRVGAGGGMLDMVPAEFADYFRDFDDDDFFRDDVHLGSGGLVGNRMREDSVSAESSRMSLPAPQLPSGSKPANAQITWPSRHSSESAESSQSSESSESSLPEQPAPAADPIHAVRPANPLSTWPSRHSTQVPEPGPAVRNPGRGSLWSRIGRGLRNAVGSFTGAISRGWNRLFGGRRAARGAQAPAAAPAPRPASFDYADADLAALHPSIARPKQEVNYAHLQMMVPGLAEDHHHSQEFDPNALVAQEALNRENAVRQMRAAMAAKPSAGGGAARIPRGDAHGSSQSALDARFENMVDEPEEDLLAPVPPSGQPAGPRRNSYFEQGDAWFNNMRDDDEAPPPDPAAHQRPSERLSLDVEEGGDLEEELHDIPKDMRDFPGADILYRPQRRRMHN